MKTSLELFFFFFAFTMYTQFNTLRVYDDSSTRKNQVNRHIEFLKSMENGYVFDITHVNVDQCYILYIQILYICIAIFILVHTAQSVFE